MMAGVCVCVFDKDLNQYCKDGEVLQIYLKIYDSSKILSFDANRAYIREKNSINIGKTIMHQK